MESFAKKSKLMIVFGL